MAGKMQITVNEGVVEGKLMKTINGFSYKSFTGIPYARPPLGNLRFRDPLPVDKWTGVLDATKEVKICTQFDTFVKKEIVGVEDCLYLNVFVPETAKKGDNLPVMFWVHGGGFYCGSGNFDLYGPDYLVPNNVILVTINYRLGPLGFLCLDVEDAPGNMGLKDQVMALKWVCKNISAFGGDPANVTVFGESAGGSSTHHLVMTPMTKGLIKQAICQSGVSLCEWSNSEDVVKSSFNLGESLGLKTTDKNELIKFLRSVPVEKMATPEVLKDVHHLKFVPVVEKKIPNVTPFSSEDVRERMIKGDFPKIPMILGKTSNEGFLMIILKAMELGLDKNDTPSLAKAVPDFKVFIPIHLQKKLSMAKQEELAQKIKNKYFPDEKNVVEKLQNLYSDYSFIKDIEFVATEFSKRTPTYYYRFGFEGNLNIMKYLFPFPYEGACHADELGYIFKPATSEISKDLKIDINEKDILVVKRMTELWTNFAKYGNPTPKLTDVVTTKWEPITPTNFSYLDITESLKFVQNHTNSVSEFWESLEK